MHAFVLAVLAVAFAASVGAQPLASTAPSSDAVPLADQTGRFADRITPAGAVLVSAGVTASVVGVAYLGRGNTMSAVLLLGGLGLGPSSGNLVQGRYADALIGTGLRVAGAGVVLIGAVRSSPYGPTDGDVAVLAVGGVTYLAGALYDVISAGSSAHRARLLPATDLQSGTPLAVLQVAL